MEALAIWEPWPNATKGKTKYYYYFLFIYEYMIYLTISNYKQISMEDGGVDRIVIDCWQQQG